MNPAMSIRAARYGAWISVYARSPREGAVIDLKLSDGRVLDQVTIRDLHSSGIWSIKTDEFVVAAWLRSPAFPVRVTHFRGSKT